MKKTLQRSILLVAAAGFIFFGINRLLEYHQNRSLEWQNARLSRGIEAGDSLAEHDDAVRHYKNLNPRIPEVHLRILQRQWLMALEMLDEIRVARSNPFLAKEVSLLYDKLAKHLREMQDRCDLVLADTPLLPESIAWRIFNVRAVVKIVASFVVLETENNWKKVQGTLTGARSDLRSAIDMVDQTAASNLERNLCRWNLEILSHQQAVKGVQSPEGDAEDQLGLRENLEAIIPEKGGYAAGKAMLRTMEK